MAVKGHDPPLTPTGPPLEAMQNEASQEALKAEVERLRQLLVQSRKEVADLQDSVPPQGSFSKMSTRGFVTLNVACSFAAGAVFVLADSYWEANQFVSGCLYVIGGFFLLLSIPALQAGRQAVLPRWVNKPLPSFRARAITMAGWTIFAMSILVILSAVLYTGESFWLLTSGGVMGIASQVLLASAVILLASSEKKDKEAGAADEMDSFEDDVSEPGSISDLQSQRDDPFHSLEGDGGDTPPDSSPASRLKAPKGDDDREQNYRSFVLMNGVLILIAVLLALAAEQSTDMGRNAWIPALTSFMVTLIAVFLTHGLGGRMLYKGGGWSFFHCWQGQSRQFLLLQLFTWLLFLVSCFCQLAFVAAFIAVGFEITKGLMYVGGVTALASEVMLLISIRHFRKIRSAERKAEDPQMRLADKSVVDLPQLSPLTTFGVALLFNTQFIPFGILWAVYVIPFFVPHWVFESVGLGSVVYAGVSSPVEACPMCVTPGEALHDYCVFSTIVVFWFCSLPALRLLRLPRPVATFLSLPHALPITVMQLRDSPTCGMLSVCCGFWMVYILCTYSRDASRGSREWRWLGTTKFFSEGVPSYFGGRVLASKKLHEMKEKGEGPLAESKEVPQYMAGFHPHGVMPCSVVWFHQCKDWGKLFPQLRMTPMVASIMHFVPCMRDFIQFFGLREVSRSVVEKTLREGRTPVVVVGGQSEMFESRAHDPRIKIVRFHKGFFRVAIQHGVPLLPVYSFGETKTFDLLEMPAVQRFFKKRMGFPFPYVPYGRWFLPIPRRRPVTVVIGAPIPVEKNPTPTPEEIDEVSTKYFAALEELFEEFKDRCGHAGHSLQFLDHR
eukprot:Hpha_TRINITY_DN16385_c2_g2::TRINITY_DN16385_c2_g2_i1::g.58200::m.58200